MATFEYRGRSADGSAATGRLEGLNKADIAAQLADQGIIPVKVELVENPLPDFQSLMLCQILTESVKADIALLFF